MTEMSTGERVARARRRQGWTQADLASRVGRSQSWVAKVEQGQAPLDRRSVLDRLAQTLDVEVVELTGQPYRPVSPAIDSGHAGIPALRLALQRASLPTYAALDRPVRPLDAVADAVSQAEEWRQAARFGRVSEILPSLIEELLGHRRAQEQSGDQVARLMVRVAHLARVTSNMTGHHDLAWTALERELHEAETLGAPAEQAAAAWDLCGAWLHAGAVAEARNAAGAALDRLDGQIGTNVSSPGAQLQQLWGALHLRAAVAYGRLWNAHEAAAHIAAARTVVTAQGNAWQTQFNAPNLAIHELEISIELGRPADAEQTSARIRVDEIPGAERLAHYWTCRARAHAMNSHRVEALGALLEAEQTAGPHVLNRPMVRELVTDLLQWSRRGIDPQLRRMATLMEIG